jgi:hypothetical protein
MYTKLEKQYGLTARTEEQLDRMIANKDGSPSAKYSRVEYTNKRQYPDGRGWTVDVAEYYGWE